eukprot:TRINITY_DN379_c1_g1_i2.p1 TRINITY_DN379_c1_g1~~TRINITY_DN379_c1_g1_i2.p1  ORF type:complete len:192 (-),score=81.75 TRINITY_DN379_c1_g1_i2:116-691(-)
MNKKSLVESDAQQQEQHHQLHHQQLHQQQQEEEDEEPYLIHSIATTTSPLASPEQKRKNSFDTLTEQLDKSFMIPETEADFESDSDGKDEEDEDISNNIDIPLSIQTSEITPLSHSPRVLLPIPITRLSRSSSFPSTYSASSRSPRSPPRSPTQSSVGMAFLEHNPLFPFPDHFPEIHEDIGETDGITGML